MWGELKGHVWLTARTLVKAGGPGGCKRVAEGCVRPCTSSCMAVRGWRWIPRAAGTGNKLGEATKRSDSGSGAVTCQCCAGWVRDGAASLPAAGGPPRHDEGERRSRAEQLRRVRAQHSWE